MFSGTQCQPLQQVLKRVCWQIADLSGNCSLVIMRYGNIYFYKVFPNEFFFCELTQDNIKVNINICGKIFSSVVNTTNKLREKMLVL